MKKRQLIILSATFALAFLAGAASLTAQTTAPAVKAPKPAVPAGKVPLCEEAIPRVKQQLQSDANAKCSTMQACVECVLRQSDIKVYAMVIVQPETPQCKTLTGLAHIPAEGQTAQPFSFEIIQSVCINSGVSLEVILPDARARASDFSFEWIIDGRTAGRGQSLECACGSTGTVKVTQTSTRQSVGKSFKLPKACTGETEKKD